MSRRDAYNDVVEVFDEALAACHGSPDMQEIFVNLQFDLEDYLTARMNARGDALVAATSLWQDKYDYAQRAVSYDGGATAAFEKVDKAINTYMSASITAAPLPAFLTKAPKPEAGHRNRPRL